MSGQFGNQLEESALALATGNLTAGAGDGLSSVVAAYRLTAEHSADLVFIFRPDGEFVYLNPKAVSSLGYAPDDLLGKTLQHIAVSKYSWPAFDQQPPTTHSEEVPRVELRRKSGSAIWLELVVTPIAIGEQLVGWLGIGRDISSQRRAEQWLLRARREASAVQVVMAEATQAVDLQATLDTTLERVLELLDAETGVIFLLSQSSNRLSLVSYRGISRAAIAHLWGPGLRPGEGVAGRVVASGEPLVLENVADRPLTTRRVEQVRVVASVPLRAEGHIVGTIGVGRRKDETFSSEEISMLANIGSQVGMVIENARLRAEVARRASRLAGLYRAGRAIADAETPATALGTAAKAAAQLTHSAATLVLLHDDDNNSFRPAAAHGLPFARWRLKSLPYSDPSLGLPIVKGQAVVHNRVPETADGVNPPTAADSETVFPAFATDLLPDARAIAAVPLRAKTRVIGTLIAIDRSTGSYDEQDMELLACLADQVTATFEHTRLHKALTEQAERASALAEITKAAVASLDLEHVVKSLAGQIRRLVDYDRLMVGLAEGAGTVLDVFVRKGEGKSTQGHSARVKQSDVSLGTVVASGQAMIRGNLAHESRFAWDDIMVAAGMRSDMIVPLTARGKPIGALAVLAAREDAYSQAELELLQRVADKVSMAVENARLYQQTMADLREITALREVVESFSAELELDSLLRKIIVAAVDLVRGDNGSIALVDESDGVVKLRALHNLPNDMLGNEVVSGVGPLGQVLATSQTVLMHRYGEGARSASADDFSCLAVPIWWQGQLIGTFAVGSGERQHRFATRDGDVLQLLAKHAAIAIENARLYRQSRDLAVTEERNRLARDIHDTLAQSLTGIVLQLETVAAMLPKHPDEAAQELQEARALARRSLDEARQSVWGLHPTPLHSTTLDQAIEREMRTLAKQANYASHFTVRGDVRQLQPDVATALFRIAQEALSNIRKHAEAKSVRGVLTFGDTTVSLKIEDDGVGIQATPASGVRRGGFGLTSMGERARLLGGELRVESAPGRGTRLVASVPYQQPPAPVQATSSSSADNTAVAVEHAIKVLVADDHPIARQGIRRMLESCGDIAVVGEAADGVEAVSLCGELQPDVILMDLQMPRMNGVQAIQQLRDENPEIKVLIISTYDKDEFLFEGIKAGARGYLLKDVPAEELAQAVRAVSRGESLLQGIVAGKLLDRLGQLARGEVNDQLTEREAEVLKQLATGARNKEIARTLFITEKTVKFHVANIFRKLNVSSRTEALASAIERGLLEQ